MESFTAKLILGAAIIVSITAATAYLMNERAEAEKQAASLAQHQKHVQAQLSEIEADKRARAEAEEERKRREAEEARRQQLAQQERLEAVRQAAAEAALPKTPAPQRLPEPIPGATQALENIRVAMQAAKKLEAEANKREAEAMQRMEKDLQEAMVKAQRKSALELRAKQSIVGRLRDPESARFQSLSVMLDVPLEKIVKNHPLGAKADVVCGMYNAKSGFGGYTGYKWFYWSSHDSKPIVPSGGNEKLDQIGNEKLDQITEDAARRTCAELTR